MLRLLLGMLKVMLFRPLVVVNVVNVVFVVVVVVVDAVVVSATSAFKLQCL